MGAESASWLARSSPMASGWPAKSISSASPPASRMNEHTHSPARRTSPARAGSALIDGICRKAASSSNQAGMRRTLEDDRGRHF
jgi:hypothetical protein